MKFQTIVALILFFLLSACEQSSTSTDKTTAQKADAIYHNAKVYTVNDAAPWAEAVAIKGDEIIFVGSDQDALALAGDDTGVTDLQGQMLLPGFIDSHAHPVAGGAYALALALDTYARPEDWVQAIAAYADANEDSRGLIVLALESGTGSKRLLFSGFSWTKLGRPRM